MYHATKITKNTLETAIEALKWASQHPDYHWTKTRQKNYEKLIKLHHKLTSGKIKINL